MHGLLRSTGTTLIVSLHFKTNHTNQTNLTKPASLAEPPYSTRSVQQKRSSAAKPASEQWPPEAYG